MSIVLVVFGALLLLAGIVGCVLPVVPGPPLAYLSLLCLSWARDWAVFEPLFLILAAVVAIAVTVLDFVIPAAGAKRYGASRVGVFGAVVGMLAGMLFFPPLGLFVGAWAGALLGELTVGKSGGAAFKAAWGVFVGTVAGILLKLGVCLAIGVYFVRELVS